MSARKPPHVFVGADPTAACEMCGDPRSPVDPASREGLHIPPPDPTAPRCPDHGYAADRDGHCLACPDPRPLPRHAYAPSGRSSCFCGQPEGGPLHVPDPRCRSHGVHPTADGCCWVCEVAA